MDFVVGGIITVKFFNFDLRSPLNTYSLTSPDEMSLVFSTYYYIAYIPKYHTISVTTSYTHNNNDNNNNNNNNIYIDRHNNCIFLCR